MNFDAMFRDAPIKRKLMMVGLLISGLSLFSISLILTARDVVTWRSRAVADLTTYANVIGTNAASAMMFNDRKVAGETLLALSAKPDIVQAILYDATGDVFAGYPALPSRAIPHVAPGHYLFTFDHLIVANTVRYRGDTLGTIYLIADPRDLYSQILHNTILIFGVALGVFLLAAWMFAKLQRVIVTPLLELAGAMQNVSAKQNYHIQVAVPGHDEIGALARTFNDMLDKIQERDTELARHREHLEEKVAQRTASLTEAQRIAHLGNWEWDIVNNTLQWSDEMYSIFGLTPQQFTANYEAFLQAVFPEDRQYVDDKVREAIEQRGNYDINFRILLQGGSVRYAHAQGEVYFAEDRHPLRMLGTVQDVTERKLAEEEIRKQQKLTTQIIETIPLRVFWKDRDLHYLGCNTMFAKDAGLSCPDELIGKTDFDMGWKNQAEIYRTDDRLVMDSNTPKLSYDEPQTTPKGGLIWLRTSKVPLHIEANETIGILGVYEDITKYKQMELKLLESEERFRKAFQNSAIGMALVGLDGRWLKVNHSLCQIIGYSEQELMNRTFQDITHPDDLQSDLDFVTQLLAGEIDHYQMEKRYFHKDGHIVWIRLSVSLIRDAQDNPIHFVSQIDDITEDKLAKEKIRESEARYRGIFEYADDIIYLLAPDGTFNSLSPSFERLTGWHPEEWLGKSFAPIIHPDDVPRALEVFHNTLSGQSTPVFELRIAKKSGEYFDSELSIVPVNPSGKIAAIGIARDITLRKLAEDKIHKLNEELEFKVQERTQRLLEAQEELVRKEKLAVLGQVAGSVGHELRNPLGVMNNAVYFLQTVLSDADETTKEYLGIIKDEIAGADRIVGDLLDSVRTKPPQIATVSVKQLIEQTLHKCSIPPIVAVHLDIPETLSPLKVDPMQIHQVFRNLISNAVEAMPEGGTLEISAIEDTASKIIVIGVRDNGIGMSPEHLAKLFQPLFTTKARGIGLGLVVVKNLIQANGGSVEVQSEPDKGTTFSITLPMADERGSTHG